MPDRTAPDEAPGPAGGLASGTLVETRDGWRPAEFVTAGELVYTYDGTARPVTEVQRWYIGAQLPRRFPNGLILVPGGTIGNCEAFYLLPDSHALLSGPAVEALCGESSALVRADHMAGHAGVDYAIPVDGIEIVTLRFEEEEVIFANTGALIHCPADRHASDGPSAVFPVLSQRDAGVLMACWSSSQEETRETTERPKRIGGPTAA